MGRVTLLGLGFVISNTISAVSFVDTGAHSTVWGRKGLDRHPHDEAVILRTLPLSGGQVLVAQKAGYCGPSARRACSKDFTLKHMKAFSK